VKREFLNWVVIARTRTAPKSWNGMTRPQFARYYLMRLGIGNELKRVALNSEFPYKLASVEEVQALIDTVLPCRPEFLPPG
jgi:hypothetical protein